MVYCIEKKNDHLIQKLAGVLGREKRQKKADFEVTVINYYQSRYM